jgi:hypothetical protein
MTGLRNALAKAVKRLDVDDGSNCHVLVGVISALTPMAPKFAASRKRVRSLRGAS